MIKKISISVIVILFVFVCLFFTKTEQLNNDNTEIKFSSWGSQSEVKILKSVISEYENNNPGIKIRFSHIPQNYFQKLHLLFASGSEPDVIFINNLNIKLYTSAGLLENLSPYFEKEKNDFFEQAVEGLSDNGNLYAIPRDISGLVIFYNKDIFKKRGIINPKADTIENFVNLCKRLYNEEFFIFNSESNPVYWLPFLSANGGGIISDDGKRVIINSKESIEALKLYSDFIHKYHYAPSNAEKGSMTDAQMFINQKSAMYVSGRWIVPKFRETLAFDWDVFAYPSKVYSDASGWAVSKNSKHKKEAVDFIKYLSSEKVSEKFCESGLIIPARKDTAKGNIFLDKTKKPYNSYAFIKIAENSKPTPVNKNYAKITDIVTEKVKTVIETDADVNNVFDIKTVKKIESLL